MKNQKLFQVAGIALSVLMSLTVMLIVLAVFVSLIWSAGCEMRADVDNNASSSDAGNVDMLNDSLDPDMLTDNYPGRGGGSLPIGFFERHCQWDAPCGIDRIRNKTNPASDPVPSN